MTQPGRVGFRDAHGVLNNPRLVAGANNELDRLQVRGQRRGPVASLSGGNQQKVMFARMLGMRPKILLLDEPTKGVDIGVKSEIHRIIRQLAIEHGLAVIAVSSEEEEVLEVADDVAVFVRGRCGGVLPDRAALTPTTLRSLAWEADQPAVHLA